MQAESARNWMRNAETLGWVNAELDSVSVLKFVRAVNILSEADSAMIFSMLKI